MGAIAIQLFTWRLSEQDSSTLQRALRCFHRAQHTIRLESCGEYALPDHGDRVDFADLLDKRLDHPTIVVTSCGLVDNWFTHTANGRSLINASDWQVAFMQDAGVPPAGPDANLLLSLSLCTFLLLAKAHDFELVHRNTRGCLCDLCEYKPERAIKMRAAYVCSECIAKASAAGMSSVENDAIHAVLDEVRELTMGRKPQRARPQHAVDDYITDATLPAGIRLPTRLVDACKDRGVTVVVGSGLSLQHDVEISYPASLGWRHLPTWAEIPERLASLLERYRGRKQTPRSAETLDEFLSDLEFFRSALGERAYYPRAIFDVFAPHVASPGLANRLLFCLPVRWLLTTNYDFVLDVAAPPGTPTYTWREARQAREYVTAAAAPMTPLLKIHGCASRPDTIILTRSEYDRLRQSAEYTSLMRYVFDVQTVLFIGYGLRDPLDLDIALEQANDAGAAQGEKYALLPKDRCEAIRERFPNVQPIAYQGHDEIAAILAVLCRAGRA